MAHDFFSARESRMVVNGLSCMLNLPRALEQKFAGGQETAHSLPPYAERAAFEVDEYPACPEHWMRGGPDARSFFVPIKVGHGLWLDFTGNERHNSHHVAVVVSAQGVNPITGMKVTEPVMEQYRDTCPRHGVAFEAGRFCLQCGYKWPGQNYISTTMGNRLWIDGFRAEDGIVRQYVITDQVDRGVAAQIIGEERVFAIGVAFYLSKQPKPKPVYSDRVLHDVVYGCSSDGFESSGGPHSFGKGMRGMVLCSARREEPKGFEIAAGAKIDQNLGTDPQDLDFWQSEPAGKLYIQYCSEDLAEAILEAGKRDLTKGGEGFLANLKTGDITPEM